MNGSGRNENYEFIYMTRNNLQLRRSRGRCKSIVTRGVNTHAGSKRHS